MRKAKKNRTIHFGLLLSSFIFSLLIAESILRLFYPTPYFGYEYNPPQEKFFQHDSLLGWRGRPNVKAVFAKEDFYVTVTLDQHGYRNTNPPFLENKKNVLVLGDSYGWGWGVEDYEIFSSYLNKTEKNLNIYNLSAPGYGPDQQYLALKQFLTENHHLDFNGVILLFCHNDFDDVLFSSRHSYPKPRFALRRNGLVLTNVPVPKFQMDGPEATSKEVSTQDKRILTQSHLYNLITKISSAIVPNLRERLFQKEEFQLSPSESQLSKKSRAIVLELFKKIEAIRKEKNMFFHVILMITSLTDSGTRWKIDRLGSALKKENIAHSFYYTRYFPSTELWIDRHFSAYGHKLLAAHICDLLKAIP